MVELKKQKARLEKKMIHYANTLGYSHPRTVKKSQELDIVINQMTFQHCRIQKEKVS